MKRYQSVARLKELQEVRYLGNLHFTVTMLRMEKKLGNSSSRMWFLILGKVVIKLKRMLTGC